MIAVQFIRVRHKLTALVSLIPKLPPPTVPIEIMQLLKVPPRIPIPFIASIEIMQLLKIPPPLTPLLSLIVSMEIVQLLKIPPRIPIQ